MQTIYTVGTTGMTYERFIGLLRMHRIDAIIDVRLQTEGPRYRFASGMQIRDLSYSQGVQYRHELRFAPTAKMLARFRADQNWNRFVERYRGIAEDRSMMMVWCRVAGQFDRPCLLGCDKSAAHCHRRLLALAIRSAIGSKVSHL